MLAQMIFRSALDYTRKMGDQALQAALFEVANQARRDVVRFLAAFAPDLLREALEAAEARKGN